MDNKEDLDKKQNRIIKLLVIMILLIILSLFIMPFLSWCTSTTIVY